MWAGFTGSWGRRSMRDCVTERLEREGGRRTEPSVQTDRAWSRPRASESGETDSNSKTLILKDSSVGSNSQSLLYRLQTDTNKHDP